MIHSINKSNLNAIFIKILTIVINNFKLLLNMENKCAICQDEIFALWHCADCEGNGPLLCYEHFLNGPCPLDLNKPKENSSLMPKKKIFFQKLENNLKQTALYCFRKQKHRLLTICT